MDAGEGRRLVGRPQKRVLMTTHIPPVWLKRSAPGDDEGAGTGTLRENNNEVDEQRRWVCRACATFVARDDTRVTLPGRPPIEVHTNPDGVSFSVATFAEAAVVVAGPRFPAFTWYPGYVWQVAVCFGCTGHLGWRYERVTASAGPVAFYGLDVDRLIYR